METTVSGVFADEARARQVAERLRRAGFGEGDVTIVTAATPRAHELVGAETDDASRGAMLGAAVGGVGSFVAGAAISPVFEASMFVGGAIGALLGAFAGSVIGLLVGSATGHMVQEEYEHMLEHGQALLAVNTTRAQAAAAHAVLAEAGAVALSTSVHRRHRQQAQSA